jgi:putative hydrolase of the HAD superfamily
MTAEIEHIFFDIGGVLGSNGWDREQRQRAIEQFHLDADEFSYRHHEIVGDWEEGHMSLDEYLDICVFYEERAFERDDFVRFMLAQSEPAPDAIAVARGLAGTRRFQLLTLNNEAAVLNEHRIERFGLRGFFAAFLSSCWLGVRKPKRTFYEKALAIAQADPARSLLIDDRDQNLAPARRLGMGTVLFRNVPALKEELRELRVLDA